MEEKFNELIKMAKKDKELVAVALFGSSLYKKGRDIDICLFLDKKYPNLKMSKKKLEYLKKFNFDIQIFQQLPMYIRNRILKEGRILLSKDYEKLYEIYSETIKEFGFYKKIYDLQMSRIKNG